MGKNTIKNAKPYNVAARKRWDAAHLVVVPLAVDPAVRDRLTADAKAAGAKSRTRYILYRCGIVDSLE